MSAVPLLVVLRPLGLGDFLTGVPAYRGLARAFPDHRRVLAAPRALRSLALSCDAFDEHVAVEALQPLPEELHGAAVAVDLHGRGPASHKILLAARPRRLIAFEHPDVAETKGAASWRADEHEVARWCRMLSHAGVACDPSNMLLRAPSPVAGAAGAAIVHPGAKSGSRRWPVERFASIAREQRSFGRRVIVTGAAGERELAEDVARLAGLDAGAVVAGATTLPQLAALVAHARVVICGDTGISHLATAFRTPSVTLFGPTSPATWGPPRSPVHRVLWHGTTGDPHAGEIDPGLLSIGVDEVRRELRELGLRPAHAARG